jgi:hypothetical protein
MLCYFFPSIGYVQGDQIERIYAQWAIVNFGHFVKISEVGQMLGYFFQEYRLCINFDKN